MTNHMTGRYDETILRLATVLVRIVTVLLWVGVVMIAIAIPAVLVWRAEALAELAKEGMVGRAVLPSLVVLMVGGAGILLATIRFFRGLLKLMDTVREGDPFVPENAARLRLMAWLLLAIEAGGLALGLFSDATLGRTHGFEFSVTGLIAVLSLFVLARVFARGTAMREDIEGTV